MKVLSFNLQKVLVLATSVFLLGLSQSFAQIGPSPQATNTPNYGIYGSAPTPAGTPFPCGTPEKATLNEYPEVDPGLNYTLPLNGSKNFNFYYTPDGNGFLSGGGYRVTYLNASGTNCYGSGDIVTYSPNSDHTNGVQVRPFNNPPATPYGARGYFLAKIPGGGGATTPPTNAVAELAHSAPFYLYKARTNGIGYVSIYYSSYSPGTFLPGDAANDVRVSGILSFNNLKCTYTFQEYDYVIWLPPGGYLYNYDFDTQILDSSTPGCQP